MEGVWEASEVTMSEEPEGADGDKRRARFHREKKSGQAEIQRGFHQQSGCFGWTRRRRERLLQ